MKSPSSITAILGLTQQQLATLLNVHRSLISLYQSNKRDLPLHAKQVLAELLANAQQSEVAKSKTETKSDNTALIKQLEKFLRENKYQQLLTQKKIAAAEKKKTASIRLIRISDYVSGKNSKFDKNAAKLISNKAKKTSAQNLDIEILKLELKRDLLNFENKLLNDKINFLTKKPTK